MPEPEYMPLSHYYKYTPQVMQQQAMEYYEKLRRRRTVREFSDKPVPTGVIEHCLKTAVTAPSGANQQPWHFVAVRDPAVKHQIREKAEKAEQAFYTHRAPEAWLSALSHLGTHPQKPFLDEAPYLIAIFAQKWGANAAGEKIKHYYVKESVGLATGFLITAIHQAGLVSLTYTPSPMDFLNKILNRPTNEKAFMILVVGYPKEDVKVPKITKKQFNEIVTFI